MNADESKMLIGVYLRSSAAINEEFSEANYRRTPRRTARQENRPFLLCGLRALGTPG
jgi:hypothetical protein